MWNILKLIGLIPVTVICPNTKNWTNLKETWQVVTSPKIKKEAE